MDTKIKNKLLKKKYFGGKTWTWIVYWKLHSVDDKPKLKINTYHVHALEDSV